MWSDKTWYGLIAIVYCLLVLAHLWPYLNQAWIAYSEKKPIRQVPRPATNTRLTGSLAFISGVMWMWLYFRPEV